MNYELFRTFAKNLGLMTTNEEKTASALFKSRSARACIVEGYRLYLSNFRRIFRYSLIAAAVYAVADCGFSFLKDAVVPRLMLATASGVAPFADMATFGLEVLGVLLAALAVMSLFFSYGFALLGQHRDGGCIAPAKIALNFNRHHFLRTLKTVLWAVLLLVVVAFVYGAVAELGRRFLGDFAAKALTGATAVALLLAVVPLAYVYVKYELTPRASFLPTVLRGYGAGLRHYGLQLSVVLVVSLLTAIVVNVTALPSLILTTASLQAETGLLQGDPLGMPGYIVWVKLVVYLLAGFIEAYVVLSALFPLYYLYGSIETQEQERKNFNKTK